MSPETRAGSGLERATLLLGRPWTLMILRQLAAQPSRFNELVGSLHGISTNLLTERIRVLSAAGLVKRTPTESSSTYALTELALDLVPILDRLERWGQRLA